MKYYKYLDEFGPLEGGFTYIELEDGYTVRQISINGDRIQASNICYSRWGLMLGEGEIKIDFDGPIQVSEISAQEFDRIWNDHLKRHQNRWSSAKSKFKLGTRVQGYIEIFYPQGVIVNLGSGALGVADYEECVASTAPENMYADHKISAVVMGYDEQYQWVVLGSPQIYQERKSFGERDSYPQEYDLV
ncbi:MAG: hypothetical protein JXA42_11065 [Anaerolineales bacterium]|nr:hypothetical protein [Anaerolineales bacterium]